MPVLESVVVNGGSRHRMHKGFLLRGAAGPQMSRDRVADFETRARDELSRRGLDSFEVRWHQNQPPVIHLVTPWMSVYTAAHRENAIANLASAIGALKVAARGDHLLAVGMEPFIPSAQKQPVLLCADVHQIEVYDDGEIERIYNLFRQYLPELIAAGANSALREGKLQKDFSLRMRNNPASFLPRYLSQYSAERLEILKRMMRRDYGLSDLRQMDINPLGGDPERLLGDDAPLLEKKAAAVELRFCDAQPSLAYLRALLLLFQAIAVQGRALARQGRRLPYLKDRVIDGNKALAIQGGLAAMFQPDMSYADPEARRNAWYHERGAPERASASLLNLIRGPLRDPLSDLGAQVAELLPLLAGLELRSRNERCLANYAEYQQYLFYSARDGLERTLIDRFTVLLEDPSRDWVLEANKREHPALVDEIVKSWQQRLDRATQRGRILQWVREAGAPQSGPEPSRIEGRILMFDAEKGFGLILGAEDRLKYQFFVTAPATELNLRKGMWVSFVPVSPPRGRRKAVELKPSDDPEPTQHTREDAIGSGAAAGPENDNPRLHGRISHFNVARNFGFIKGAQNQTDYFFVPSELARGASPKVGLSVTFTGFQQPDGKMRALKIKPAYDPTSPLQNAQPAAEAPMASGRVKSFNSEKGFGWIVMDGSEDIFVHKSDLVGFASLEPGCAVRFLVAVGPRGKRATRVEPDNGLPQKAEKTEADGSFQEPDHA